MSGDTKEKFRGVSEKFYSPLITTTEERLVEMLCYNSGKAGYIRRLIEIQGEKGDFTVDKEHADKLNKFISEYHGFVDYYIEQLRDVLSQNIEGDNVNANSIVEQLNNRWEDKKTSLNKKDKIKKAHPIVKAFIDTIALIEVCVESLNEVFCIGMSEQAIEDILIKNISNNVKYFSYFREDAYTGKVDDEDKPSVLKYLFNVYSSYFEDNDIDFLRANERDNLEDVANRYNILPKVKYEQFLKMEQTMLDRQAELESELLDCEVYSEEYFEKLREIESARRSNALSGAIVGFYETMADGNKYLFITGDDVMRDMLGISDMSYDFFKKVCKTLVDLKYMLPGQNKDANTIKRSINGIRKNYYVINTKDYDWWKINIFNPAVSQAMLELIQDKS
jgi:hypothetical protein